MKCTVVYCLRGRLICCHAMLGKKRLTYENNSYGMSDKVITTADGDSENYMPQAIKLEGRAEDPRHVRGEKLVWETLETNRKLAQRLSRVFTGLDNCHGCFQNLSSRSSL